MGHWARIDDNNIVQEVLVIKEAELDTGNWGDKSKWIKTSYNTNNGKHYVPKDHQDWSEESADQSKAIRYRFANIGYTYDADNDVFIPPKPADYMIFNKTTWDWDHPVAYPSDGLRYRWDEDVYKSDNTKGWVLDMPTKIGDSWVWNTSASTYDPPIDYPADIGAKAYRWDEDLHKSDNTKGWVEIDPETGKDI